MLKRLCFLLILVSGVVLLSGCSSASKASLGSEFTLSVGQSTRIASESMDIKFVDVIEDSRCPKGVTCIWAGQVSCAIEITKDNTENPITLTDSAGTGSSEGYIFQNYKIVCTVSPYPEAGKPIADGDYRLSITVAKE
ncbi:MAG: hypothetical protein PHY28_06885 [Dehalococcoidales bacterium]|nr:hypothetical protein [Dehalococcoidales bacterium]